MKQRVVFFLKNYLFWVVLFLLQKPIFMLVQHSEMSGVTAGDWLQVVIHAFPLDLCTASYVAALFALLMLVSVFVDGYVTARMVRGVMTVLLGIAMLALVADNGLFPYWGFHLDKTVFLYLQSPHEVLACAPWHVWLISCLIWLVCWAVSVIVYDWWMRGLELLPPVTGWKHRCGMSMGWLLITGVLFLPIRGSVTTSTMNTGRVYFSDNQMLNIAAVNPLFNVMESLNENTFDVQRYTFMEKDEAAKLVQMLLPKDSRDSWSDCEDSLACESVFTTPHPNIVLLILESFSHNAWEAMPSVRQLAGEGVYFSQVLASSFRTDRGVVAVLSGFPGQPTSSLMTVPYKSQNLPQLSKELVKDGYKLKFWYGGDEDFTNMRSYLICGGYGERVSDQSFPVSERLSKWGVQDHVLFSRLSDELLERARCGDGQENTLDVVLSLSSHEPFEVPSSLRFDSPYLNSVAYTDSCIGALVDSLRTSPLWEKTLLVLVADHGYPYPEGVRNQDPRRYHIPIVLAGGVVKGHMQVDKVCSQIDLVPTLLAQMGLPYDHYVFGKNMLDPQSVPFAFFSYNDGFGLVTESDTVVVDGKSGQLLQGKPSLVERQARAMMQSIMQAVDSL